MSEETFCPYVGIRPLHENRFVAVVGGSGSGKSSLIRAGLIPALKGGYLIEDSSKWLIAVLKPGQNPMYNLAKAILQQVDSKIAHSDILDFIIQLKKEGVKAILNLIKPLTKDKNFNFFLLIDQFEELFRFAMELKDIAKKTEAVDFVNMILKLSEQRDASFYIVLTMRSDFIGDCAQFHDLPEALNRSQYLVPRLNRQQLKMVIEGPAKLNGIKFSPALSSQLLNDLGNVKDELPLIQHALMRIWEHEMSTDKNGTLDLEDYKAIGGFEKALDQHADEALESLSTDGREIAKVLFQALTDIDENRRKIRRPLLLKDLEQLTGASERKLLDVIDHFIRDKRSFLILEQAGEKGDYLIDISHESLIRQWDTLNQWVDEESESATAYKKLAEDTRLFLLKKKDLLTGSELQLALEWRQKFNPTAVWANRYSGKTFKDCMHYLKASENERRRSKVIERARRKNRRYTRVALGTLLVIITVISVVMTYNTKNAEKTTNALYLKSEIFKTAIEDPTKALQLAQKALEGTQENDTTKISMADIESIYSKNSIYRIVAKDPSRNKPIPIGSTTFSPDGTTILTGSNDNIARLWDSTGVLKREFKGHNEPISSVAFSPDSTKILTGSEDSTAILWNLEGKTLAIFKGHDGPIRSVTFSPTGDSVVTGSNDKTAILWNLNGDTLVTFKGHSEAINSVAFSRKGDRILTGSGDQSARIWDLNGDTLRVFKKRIRFNDSSIEEGHKQPISSVAFSPDGSKILTGSKDNTAILWNLEGNVLQEYIGHDGPISSVAFSPDGTTILTGSKDKTARLWDLSGILQNEFKGHNEPISSVDFSPDGTIILTGSEDGTAREWPLLLNVDAIFKGHKSVIKSVAFSPDSVNQTLLTGSDDKTAILWNLKGDSLVTYRGHTGTIYSVAFSPAGDNILTGSKDRTAILWDLKGNSLETFEGHSDRIYAVSISPKGDKILTGSKDSTSILWDLKGNSLVTFKGHTGPVYSVAFSPTGDSILTGSNDKTAILWNLKGDSLVTFKGHTEAVNSVAFSPQGDTILTGSGDWSARLWDLKGDSLVTFNGHTGKGHTGPVNSVSFSPNGDRILTGSADKVAIVWDLKTEKILEIFVGHTLSVNSVAFSKDGKQILTGSSDNTARLSKFISIEDLYNSRWWKTSSDKQSKKKNMD